MMELFETALEQEEDDFTFLLHRYSEVHERLLLSIDTFKKEEQSESENENEKKNIIEPMYLNELLEQIVEKAKNRKALACKELSVELQKYEWSKEYKDMLDNVVLSLKRYQFKEAIIAIEEIQCIRY